jgi:hypothetical protein
MVWPSSRTHHLHWEDKDALQQCFPGTLAWVQACLQGTGNVILPYGLQSEAQQQEVKIQPDAQEQVAQVADERPRHQRRANPRLQGPECM